MLNAPPSRSFVPEPHERRQLCCTDRPPHQLPTARLVLIMSYITRRALSTLIPPKIASPTAIGAAQDAVRMQKVVSFYEKLPRGPAPADKGTGILGRYRAKYMGKNPSAAPLLHVMVALGIFGYAQNYYFHLRHHKNNAH
ncbi:hypothetical protein BLS_005976 [Venturia inaequalis]|uniref:Mitochondrial F1F0 ATP synthase subunit F n=2 Tax=Venturia inaequalis TaxID=5025 RepID=A0A8H3UU77_VENIN|nr:hypothetical protein BLS_005976 [Venturia inaequalis]KAE9976430.1 hypothetical protein EG327_008032 [Venturia inaequalis]RDI78329.1 hypothetical protein Vi05172_g11726 [Venturia inaequalis]